MSEKKYRLEVSEGKRIVQDPHCTCGAPDGFALLEEQDSNVNEEKRQVEIINYWTCTSCYETWRQEIIVSLGDVISDKSYHEGDEEEDDE